MANRKFKKRSTTKKRNMATKKKHKTLSAGRKRRRKGRKSPRRRVRRLSDAFTPMQFQTTMKTMGGGALGGAELIILEKMGIDNLTPFQKGVTGIVVAAANGLAGQLNTCAGFSGAFTYKMYTESQANLSEGNANFTNEMAQLPAFLNEDNQPMQLAQGEYMLSEGVDMLLSEMYGMPSFGPQY